MRCGFQAKQVDFILESMPSALNRFVLRTYLRYWIFFLVVLWATMFPLLMTIYASYPYVIPVLSLVGSLAYAATLLEWCSRQEISTLQRYGVTYAQVFRPLVLVIVMPIALASLLALVLATNRLEALYWSALGICATGISLTLALDRLWSDGEAIVAKSCFCGVAVQIVMIAGGAWLITAYSFIAIYASAVLIIIGLWLVKRGLASTY